MSKFGELVNSEIPILIDFYSNWDEDQEDEAVALLKEVAIALEDTAKVIKIDTEKNETLAKALRIKNNPTFIIYKNSDMKWRQSGKQDAASLISMVEQFL
ncbi:MAG TPA: thioredoxin [Lutibacter sp.]|nr:thioredoxin [Lutibacter sp.]